MARKKKNNPYEEYGLQAAGLSSGSKRTYKTNNPYEEYGLEMSKQERDPSLVWDWNKPSNRDVAERVAQQKNQPEEEEKKPERKRSIWERIGDAFEANSPEDKEKRKEAGQPEIYQQQKALEKEAKIRNDNFNFSKEEVEARREYYQRQGVDIDKMLDIQNRYPDAFKSVDELSKLRKEGKGVDFKKLVEQAQKEGLFNDNKDANSDLEYARQLEKQGSKMTNTFYAQALYKTIKQFDPKEMKKIEQDYSDYAATLHPEGTAQQVNRNFQRGLVEQIVKLPSSARTLAAGAVDLVAPEGSRVDKFAQKQYDEGSKSQKKIDQKLVDQGVGQSQYDNPVVANISSGAGSLTSSILMAELAAPAAASKTTEGASILAKAKSALNPGLAGGVFGTNAAAEQYIGAIDHKKSDFQAFATAIIGGAAEGYLEKVGLDKYLGAEGKIVKKFFTRALTEGLQEASQSLAQSGVTSTYTSVDMSDALLKSLEEGKYGAIVGGGGSLALDLAQDMQSKGVPKDAAEQAAAAVEAKVSKAAEEEGIAKPEDGDEIIKALQANGINPEQGQVEGVAGQELPTDGDQIVKQLQDTENVAQQGAPQQGGQTPPISTELPSDGDQIIKKLQETEQAGGAAGTELPSDGDQIVKQLQQTEQGGAPTGTELPSNGDEIVKQLQQTEAGAAGQTGAGQELPTDGDQIVKQLQDTEPVGVEGERPKGSLKPLKQGKESEDVMTHLNPSGGIVNEYTPDRRATMKLADNITTLSETMKRPADETITIYRGAPSNQKDIVPGDYVTTNKELAQSYTGHNNVISKEVKLSDVLDDRNEPLGEEYIYRPKEKAKPKGTVKRLNTSKKADYEVRYPETKELPANLKEKVPLDQKELQKSGKQQPKSTSQLTPNEVSAVQGKETLFTKQATKELLRLIPNLKSNPKLKVINGKYDIKDWHTQGARQSAGTVEGLMLEYKDGTHEFKIPLESLGITKERLEAAGIKAGDTVDISGALNSKGKVATLRNSRTGVDYHAGVDNRTVATMGNSSVARSPEELIEKINQLNKAGQAQGILRKGQLKSKKAAGLHQAVTNSEWQKGKLGTVKLRDDVLKNPNAYMTVLAHELSHAMEFAVNGTTGKTLQLFGDLSKEDKATVTSELKAIVDNIEGADVVAQDPSYFYKPTEMMARYVETMLLEPSKLESLAPRTTELFQQAVVRNPQLGDLIDAVEGNIDKGFKNKTPDWWRDLRQIYQKHLGKKVGDIAYNAELVRRAKLQHWQKSVGDLIKEKFKGVKDDPALLFRTAEAIKSQDADGNFEFGTRDFVKATTKEEIKDLKDNGWEFVRVIVDHNNKQSALFAKQRYTEEQGKAMFESLSPEGQKLIKDFTANKEQARDMFNRNVMRDVFKIDSNIEGWVHRGIRDEAKGKMTLSGKKGNLRERVAGMKKQRTETDGHLEDFKKQMEKALREAGDADINNQFILKQMARISKPIAKGENPDKGWVEVTYDPKRGLRLPGETGRERVSITRPDYDFESGMEVEKTISFLKPEQRYQVPAKLAEHYRNIRHVPDEISRTQRVMQNISKYWAVNVLLHGGTVGTNFVGGGIQYGAKVANDFYVELLKGDVTMPQTRRNVGAMLQVLLPRGWSSAPDYVYGGNHSNYAGQFMSKTKTENVIEKAGDIGLKPFSAVESYWKKVIMISEQAHKMDKKTLGKEMVEFSKQEEDMLGHVNQVIDLYAYDYDNVPMWLESWSAKGGLIKPFAKYPYKYTKMVTNLATGAFDQTLPWQERTAKLLTLSTMVALSLALTSWRDRERETPEGSDKTPGGLDPRGRLFLWKRGGQELFIRTAKYPFINLTSIGRNMVKGDWEEARNVMTDQFGTMGLGLDTLLVLVGRPSKFEQYEPMGAQLGSRAATLIPGFRILNDIGRLIDSKPRSPQNFVQGIGSTLPIWGSEETKSKYRGDARTVKVPVEPSQRKKGETETIEKDLQNYDSDILLSMLTGFYITRINPEDAKQQKLREQRNAAEKKIEALLTDGKEEEATKVAQDNGLTIPANSFNYYRRLREKRAN